MILKKCAHCSKDIPSSIAVCPYCQRDESGHDFSVLDENSASLDAQGQADLRDLGSDDPFLRKTAADRLGQRGSSVVFWLVKLLHEHTHKGVVEAARLLGRLRDRRAVPALAQAIKIGNEDLHTAAVWALCQINDPQALEELLHESERNHPAVQSYIAHGLASYHDPRVRSALIKLAQHPTLEVAFQAVYALGEAGDVTAVRPLRKLLTRKESLLKVAAGASLKRLGGPVRRLIPGAAWWVGSIVVTSLLVGSIYFYR